MFWTGFRLCSHITFKNALNCLCDSCLFRLFVLFHKLREISRLYSVGWDMSEVVTDVICQKLLRMLWKRSYAKYITWTLSQIKKIRHKNIIEKRRSIREMPHRSYLNIAQALKQLHHQVLLFVFPFFVIMSRPSSDVTYKDVDRIGNWIYLHRLQPQQITFLPTSRLPRLMPEVLASANF
jgi:hypothetical protein